MHSSYSGIIAHRFKIHITIDPCFAGSSDDQLNDIYLLQGDMYSFHMAPTELLTGLYITRYNAPKLVYEHTGHAVYLSYNTTLSHKYY